MAESCYPHRLCVFKNLALVEQVRHDGTSSYQMLAAVTGLASIFHASAFLFEAIRYAGVAYLLFMAWVIFWDGEALKIDDTGTLPPDFEVIR